MNLTQLANDRWDICKQCQHYNSDSECCTIVAKPGHPVLRGYVHHPNGIRNPASRCPINKWGFLPSRHASMVNDTVEIPTSMMLGITKTGVSESNIFEIMSALFFLSRKQPGKSDLKRSDILKVLKEIQLTPNDHKHL